MATTTTLLLAAFQFFDSLPTAVHILSGTVIAFAFLFWFAKKEIRLFRNRRRPIMIFSSVRNSMEMEITMLRDAKLFNIPEGPTSSFQDVNRLGKHGLVIIGYTPKMEGLADILIAVKTKKIPIIVYTKERLDTDEQKLLESYQWYSVCNFPMRLLNDVFATLSTFPL